MVNANIPKKLPNVLPNGNPFHVHIEYTIYGAVGADGCPPTLTHLNNLLAKLAQNHPLALPKLLPILPSFCRDGIIPVRQRRL
jgi:hypothetical protein